MSPVCILAAKEAESRHPVKLSFHLNSQSRDFSNRRRLFGGTGQPRMTMASKNMQNEENKEDQHQNMGAGLRGGGEVDSKGQRERVNEGNGEGRMRS
jgi:hypothetical protein